MIAAAGDVACDPTEANYNGGLGTATACRQRATSDLLTGRSLASVLTLGDLQNEDGLLWKFNEAYDPTAGREMSFTRPHVGS